MTTTQPPDTDVLDVEPVDTPAVTTSAPAAPAGRELKPLLASWLKDRGEFTEKVTDVSRRTVHTTTWHVLHSPLHLLRILRYAPRGLWRVIRLVWGWVMDFEGRPLRREAVNANQAKEYLHLAREREHRIHRRWIGLVATSVVALVGLVVAWFLLPSWQVTSWFALTRRWVFAITGAAAMSALGYMGRPLDRPLLPRASDRTGNPPLRPELILDALCSLGIAKMTEPDDIRILCDLTREGTVGSSVEIELPKGVTATAVLERRSALSAALRRPLGTVWPMVGKRHEAHLVLYVSDENMSTAKQRPWPLLRQGSVDVFKSAPMFTDQRGSWISLVLAYTCGVIGAVPRMGKTFVLRLILLVGALDPRCKEYVYDLKGTGDLSALKLIAHRYGVGDEPDDIDQQLNEMRGLRQEMRRRAKVIRELPDELCPDRKVTTELASRKDLGLEPVLVGVDECQCWFEHEEKAIANEFIAICTDLVKRGPAVGIMCYFATQKPDANSIPTAISANAVIRFCLKVHGQTSNDQVLGTSSYKNGIRATEFAFEDKGLGYFRGEGSEAQIARSVFGLDAVAAGKVALRARAARQQSGRLTGFAAGEALEREVEEVILLDDVRQVVGTADTMHLTDLVTGLGALRPGAWGSLDAASLASQLRTAGVTVASVHVSGKPRYKASGKGVKREWLDVDTTLQVGNADPEGGVVRQLRP